MDAFYASIEQRDDPALRGKPVIVGGLGNRGVVSTASYEARRFGVHSAMPTARARRLCPDGIFVVPRMQAYAEASARVRAVFDRYTDLVEPLSLDEAFLDVTGSRRLFGDGPTIAADLRRRVREATDGLTVSVGVASTKFVAKVASDLDKPDGVTVVEPGGEREFLAPLPIARLWGAGPATQKRLADVGIRRIGDLQTRDAASLAASVGPSLAEHLVRLARGDDVRDVVPGRPPKSISHETTFGLDVSDDARLDAVLLKLSEDVGRRLRARGLVAGTLKLKLRFPPFRTVSRQLSLDPPSCEDRVLVDRARELVRRCRRPGEPVRLIGVGTSDLAPQGRARQAELFGQASTGASEVSPIDATLDAIRDRFGDDAAGRAASASTGPRLDWDGDALDAVGERARRLGDGPRDDDGPVEPDADEPLLD